MTTSDAAQHIGPTTDTTRSARMLAETLASFVVVFAVVATSLFSAGLGSDAPVLAPGIAPLAVACAGGLSLGAMTAAVRPVSGGYCLPVFALGAAAAGRLAWADAWRYSLGHTLGAVLASTTVMLIGLFGPGAWLELAQNSGFAGTGWNGLSPAGFGMPAAILIEVVATAILVATFLTVTARESRSRVAPAVVGAAFIALHLVAYGVDGASLNPARSLGSALYGGTSALAQLWVFVVFPIVGALLAGVLGRALAPRSGNAARRS